MANLEHAEDDSKHVKMSTEITATSTEVQSAEVSSRPKADAGVVACSIPSFAAASELLSAPYSCLVMSTHRRHITLPPMYLHKKRTGIKEELEAELLKFSQSLEGVPIAYDNIRIVGQHGNIFDDSGYIHMDVEANFIIFHPSKGQRLVGKVNKIGVGHVGCLVHGCFNASIPKPNLVPVETWRDAGPRIGADLEFEVTALDADTFGVLLIRGRLDRTSVQELLAMVESSESNITTDQPCAPEIEPNVETTDGSPEETPKKKKRKKVKVEETEEEITSLNPQLDANTSHESTRTLNDENGEEAGKKKKKKKKKDKCLKEEEEEVEVSHLEVQGGSDSSGYVSEKSSKKRKHKANTDIMSTLNDNTESPKPKKKMKSEIEQFA